MKAIILFFSLILFCSTGTFATYVAVLETAVNAKVKNKVSLSDRQYLTNVLREEAVKQLPATQNYTIMTRENILQMLPPGKSIEDCEGSCLVETGKNIAADYVCQARVGSFGGVFSLSAELYETAGNKLIASFNGQGANLNDLLEIIQQKSPNFFKSVKGTLNSDVTSEIIEDYTETESFNVVGHRKFFIEIETSPEGAIPTIDGKGLPKCPKTPCKVQVNEGRHKFIATQELYDDAVAVVDIVENNQKVVLNLSPSFGRLIINPVFEGNVLSKGVLNVFIDGQLYSGNDFALKPGVHTVQMKHRCYEPVKFKVAIEKNQTKVFDQKIPRAKGWLELHAKYKQNERYAEVIVDGAFYGGTPFVGEVPLCAEILLRENGLAERIDVEVKRIGMVYHTHEMTSLPPKKFVTEEEKRVKAEAAETARLANALQQQQQFDTSSNNVIVKSVPTNVEMKKKKKIRWGPLCISGAAVVAGVTIAIVGNIKAKDAYKAGFNNTYEYKRNKNEANVNQSMRNVGIALAITGAIGMGVSILF